MEETIKIDKLNKLINSKEARNQYLATCLIRKDKSLNQKEFISKIPITGRINSLRDVFIETSSSEDILLFKTPQNAFERYINACILIPKIVEAYNEGWVPNWNDTNEYKYFPYFEKKGSVWVVRHGYVWSYGCSGLPAYTF